MAPIPSCVCLCVAPARLSFSLSLPPTPTPPLDVHDVLAVQVLPGPEATELACYFGRLAGGPIGSVVGGLGFVLPGFILMIIAAWVRAVGHLRECVCVHLWGWWLCG